MRVLLSVAIFAIVVTSPEVAAAATTCGTVAACIMGINTAGGPGLSGSSQSGHAIDGTSAMGYGVVGITKASSKSPASARAGVYGEDESTNNAGLNSGVAGTSTFGSGVIGTSNNGVGGAFTTFGSGNALVGFASLGSGANLAGYFTGAVVDSYELGMTVDAEDGTGLVVSGGIGYLRGGEGIAAASQETVFHAYANDGPAVGSYVGNANVFVATKLVGKTAGGPQTATDVVTMDSEGNADFAGSVTMHASPSVRMKSSTGAEVATFVNRTSTATLEDMGGGSLVNGAAYVPLDPAFATLVDRRTKYLVFLTPQGDSHGLYVTQMSSKGFAVRENANGRASLAFAYRIVAKPLDGGSERLPATMAAAHALNRTAVPVFTKMRAALLKRKLDHRADAARI